MADATIWELVAKSLQGIKSLALPPIVVIISPMVEKWLQAFAKFSFADVAIVNTLALYWQTGE